MYSPGQLACQDLLNGCGHVVSVVAHARRQVGPSPFEPPRVCRRCDRAGCAGLRRRGNACSMVNTMARLPIPPGHP